MIHYFTLSSLLSCSPRLLIPWGLLDNSTNGCQILFVRGWFLMLPEDYPVLPNASESSVALASKRLILQLGLRMHASSLTPHTENVIHIVQTLLQVVNG